MQSHEGDAVALRSVGDVVDDEVVDGIAVIHIGDVPVERSVDDTAGVQDGGIPVRVHLVGREWTHGQRPQIQGHGRVVDVVDAAGSDVVVDDDIDGIAWMELIGRRGVVFRQSIMSNDVFAFGQGHGGGELALKCVFAGDGGFPVDAGGDGLQTAIAVVPDTDGDIVAERIHVFHDESPFSWQALILDRCGRLYDVFGVKGMPE